MKIVSWNVNSLNKRGEQVLEILDVESPDVMMIQETRGVSFPDIIQAADKMKYIHYSNDSVGGRAGVMTLLKADNRIGYRVDATTADIGRSRLLIVTDETRRKAYVNIYVNQGVEPGHTEYVTKLALMSYLTEKILSLEMDYEVILAGDFNITANDEGVWSTSHWGSDTICCTPAERDVFDDLMHMTRLINSKISEDDPNKFSWYSYRHTWRNVKSGSWDKYGIKIDHILGPKEDKCEVLLRYRQMDKPSDHCPIMVIT